jgi:site-specific DNA recombinase
MNNLEAFEKFIPTVNLNLNRTKAVIYTRVSTKEQADTNTSLETQKKYCENYAKSQGLDVIGYFGGTFESAKSDDRKEFQKLLKYVKQSSSVGYIIVYSYDRFSRTGSNASQITSELSKHGIKVKAVSQEVNTDSASGKFQQNLFYLFSQFDNELRKDKTITAMTELLRQGYWLWTPPIGYENKKKYHKAVEWDIVINEDGEFLKKAFKWKAQNKYSNAEIARKLNALGFKINDKRLHDIFKNPFYCGVIITKMLPGEVIEGKHEPIISKENFLKIHSKERIEIKEYEKDRIELPLKHSVFCHVCKGPLTGFLVKQKGLYYYKCRTANCNCTKSALKLHDEFAKELSKFEIPKEFSEELKAVMEYTFEEITQESTSSITTSKKKITELKKKINTLEERFALGEINQDIFTKFNTQYQEEIKTINENLEGAPISSSNLEKAIKKAITYSSKLSKIWYSGSLNQKVKLQNLVFSSGFGYDKQNNKVQTFFTNSIFVLNHSLSENYTKIKSGNSINFDQISALVTPLGFKPKTSTAVM